MVLALDEIKGYLEGTRRKEQLLDKVQGVNSRLERVEYLKLKTHLASVLNILCGPISERAGGLTGDEEAVALKAWKAVNGGDA
jgi:hypothetical protein